MFQARRSRSRLNILHAPSFFPFHVLLRSSRVHSAAWLAEDDEVGQVVDNGAGKIEGPLPWFLWTRASEAYVRVTWVLSVEAGISNIWDTSSRIP